MVLVVPNTRREGQKCRSVSIWFLILSNLLVFQFGGWFTKYTNASVGGNQQMPSFDLTSLTAAFPATTASVSSVRSVLDIPQGQAVALPSIRIDDQQAKYNRNIYGGKGDKPHLGGFNSGGVDQDGVSPALWKWMVEHIGIKTLLDVGCGRGVSTSWFHLHGVKTLCVEGSHDALEQTLLPKEIVYEHDFSRGPWWPPQTIDAAWSVEVLEHVGRNFHENLLPSFRKAGLIFASHSSWGGWHHVEVHETDWWILKFESYGFKYSKTLSEQVKQTALQFRTDPLPNGDTARAQHLWLHMMVFINPEVAALPQHHHLFAEPGCFGGYIQKDEQRITVKRDCGTGVDEQAKSVESPIPDSFKPLKLDKSQDEAWERLVFGKTLAEYQAEPPAAEGK